VHLMGRHTGGLHDGWQVGTEVVQPCLLVFFGRDLCVCLEDPVFAESFGEHHVRAVHVNRVSLYLEGEGEHDHLAAHPGVSTPDTQHLILGFAHAVALPRIRCCVSGAETPGCAAR
jgi:hypothetical protein